MTYTIIDILNKLIIISEKRNELCRELYLKENSISVKIVRKALISAIDREIFYYKDLKEVLDHEEVEDIDFFVYDKISSIMNEFNNKKFNCCGSNPQELLNCSLIMDKKIYALLLDVQGRLLQKEDDTKTKAYKILSSAIKSKENHINDLEKQIRLT